MRKFACLLLLFFSFTSVAIGAGSENKNYTPAQIWEKADWMPKAKVSGAMTDGPDDIYFLQSTVPAPGYIHLSDGTILSGNLQIQRRFNKSERDVSLKCIIIQDGKRKVYSMDNLDYFYLAFTEATLDGKATRMARVGIGTSSYFEYKVKSASGPSETFGPGAVTFTNGAVLNGTFALDKGEEKSGNLVYKLLFFAEKPGDNMTIYRATAIEEAVKKVGGKDYHIQPLLGGLTELGGWVSTLKDGKADQTTDLLKGTILLDTDETRPGWVGLGKGKVPLFAYFINADESFVNYFDAESSPQANQITVSLNGKDVEYTFGDDGFYSLAEMNKLWEKSAKKKSNTEFNTLVEGSIILKDGTERKGKVAQQTLGNPNVYIMGQHRQTSSGIFFQDANGQIRLFGRSQLKAFTQKVGGQLNQFVVIERHLDKNEAKARGIPTTSYQIVNNTAEAANIKLPGIVGIGDKQISTARVQVRGNDVWYYGTDGTLNVTPSSAVATVQINDPAGKRLYMGDAPAFNEVRFPFEALSYYKNPNPTHCNEKASKLKNSVSNFAADLAMTGAVMTAASASENKSKTPEQLVSEGSKTFEPLHVDPNGCSVMYEEYFLVINSTKEKILVYQENIKPVVTSLMLGCEDLKGVNKRIRKKSDIGDLDEMVAYVNTHGCASKQFEILEPTPLAAYKWRTGFLSLYNYDDKGEKGTKRAMTDWYQGWVQTIGGNKVEGLISIIGEKKIENRQMTKTITKGNKTVTQTSSSIFNRKVTFDYDGVELRIVEKHKLADLVYSFSLSRDVIRSIGRDKVEGSIEGQYVQFDSLQVYEPTKELFLSEEVKVFTPNGSFTNGKGETVAGKITLDVPPALWFATSATYEDEDGNKIDLHPKDEVLNIKITTGGVERKYVPYRGVFVEVLVDGPEFRYFRNPYPESKSESVAFIANVAAQAQLQSQESSDPADRSMQNDPTLVNASKLEAFRKEYVFQNGETNEEIIVHSGNDKKLLGSYLSLCDQFNAMDKKKKEDVTNAENPKAVIQMLDSCY